METLNWSWASPTQYEAFTAPEHWKVLLVGGQGSGKTTVWCRKIIRYLLTYPRSRFLIIRKTYRHLKSTVMVTWYEELPRQYLAKRNDQDGTCQLTNGSEVKFLHLDQESSAGALLSLEINGVFINEAVEVSESHVNMALRRVGRWTKALVPGATTDWRFTSREGIPIPPPMVLFDSNPDDGDDQHWMVKRFYDESPYRHDKRHPEIGTDGLPSGRLMSYAELGYVKFEMPSFENRFLPIENLQGIYAAGDIERFVFGKRGRRRGQIHVIHPDSLVAGSPGILDMIRSRCRLSRVLDHGVTAPTCCLWAGTDSSGNVYIYREYYQPDKLISYHRDAIQIMSDREHYHENLADPSIFAKTMRRGADNRCTWSVADEYLDRGMYKAQTAIAWSKANNDEFSTRNRINEYLRFDEAHINPFTNQRGSPRLFFITQSPEYPDGCVHAHRETGAQRLVLLPDETFSQERDEEISDHAYDCTRYLMAARQAIKPAKPGYPKGSIGWDIQQQIVEQAKRDRQEPTYGL